MRLKFPGYGYCIDTSALIDLKEIYPYDVFPSLWKNIGQLISEGRLIAPAEVFKELKVFEDKKDKLLEWARKHKKMFKGLDDEQQKYLHGILKESPNLVDKNKITPEADPFIIALALSEGYTVITSEKPSNPGGRPRIPNVCQKYQIKCVSLKEFFREQKWNF